MKYYSVGEFALKKGISVRRVQQMCKNNEIPNVVKEGHAWKIPYVEKDLSTKKYKPLPIGISDYKLATSNYYYVDKTLMIRDFLDNRPMVSLFTRPRRFGKTLNMDMLRVFFEKTAEDTSIYFQDKLIWQCEDEYKAHQGKYPVIFLTFKDVKYSSWEETLKHMTNLIIQEYQRHIELETSENLSNYDKEIFSKMASGNVDSVEIQMALRTLSLLLNKHYQQRVIIIIDEYDTPIQQGYLSDFYDEIISFMRNFFSGGLKDNPNLAYGFLTGILRVAKESVFSGLNNLKIYSVLDDAYSQYFGFTCDEIKEMLQYYGAEEKYEEVCEWYDGYQFGHTEIFNPWSVINYIADQFYPKAFWQLTGSNEIIGNIIASATVEITKSLHELLRGKKITTYIETSVIYPEIQNDPYSIYSFLLVSGYLKVTSVYPQNDGNFMCDVSIPNKEIMYVYEKEVLNKTNKNAIAIAISQAIFQKNQVKLQNLLEQFMMESISSFDTANEGFYHGMMLGLCAVLSDRYLARSNRESGLGRFDILLLPKSKTMPGFIYEFKYTKDEKMNLDSLAEEALKQIETKKYDSELQAQGIKNVIKMGIAFSGKKVAVKKIENRIE